MLQVDAWRILNQCVKYSVLVPRRLPQPTQLELDVPKYKKRNGLESVEYDISWWYDYSGWFFFLVFFDIFVFFNISCHCSGSRDGLLNSHGLIICLLEKNGNPVLS